MGQFDDDDDDEAFHSSIPVPMDITVAVVYSVFGVCSLFGNSTLLYVSYKKKYLLKPAEFFIINLAISDLGLTLTLYPMAIASSIYRRWLYGRTACLVYAFCGMLFGICSLTTLTLLSMVCFVKVCYPLYGNKFNARHSRLLIACAWVYALLFASSPLVHWGEYGAEPYGTACCIDWRLSNKHAAARSFTVALFVFCYILPCCLIVASYTGILVTVHASRKTMEQHASRRTHMSSIQTVIVKLSVAVCIGFFAAWSPYAVVSMWAAFGHIEKIPPLAFAVSAMFAKSSTIYNPVIYLLLRPNFRKEMCRDLGALFHVRVKGRPCSRDPGTFRSKPTIRVIRCTACRQTNRMLSSNCPTRPPAGAGETCREDFECFRRYPQACHLSDLAASGDACEHEPAPAPQTIKQKIECQKQSLLAAMCAKRIAEVDNLQINLEMVPGPAKVAWP